MSRAFAEISFTPSVRAVQEAQGSARSYGKFLEADAVRGDQLGPEEAEFIEDRDGFFQATISESDWPYVQFRGGPVGFLKVLDATTLAYADFRGNRQYISTGNLSANDRISLILVDYPNRRRLKVWGRAKLVSAEDDPALIAKLQDSSYRGKLERAVVITIEALDWNCPQHIPQRMTVEEFEPHMEALRNENTRLGEEIETLKSALDAKD